jgi:hypothetical protein
MVCPLFELPTLGFALALDVAGLPPEVQGLLEARWPPRAVGANVSGTLFFEAIQGPVGLPAADLVTAEVTFTCPTVAEVVTNTAVLSLDLGNGRVEGRGRVDAGHARGGVEAAVRAAGLLALAQRGVFVLHASAVHLDGDALVLLGASSAGKTTTARRLGREGLRRIADDMIAIDLEARPPALHGLPFERAGRALASNLAARDSPIVCRGGALVRKGARSAGLSPVENAPHAWAEALIALPSPPGTEPLVLSRFARLCEVPLCALDAPPSGPLAPAVLPWLASLRATGFGLRDSQGGGEAGRVWDSSSMPPRLPVYSPLIPGAVGALMRELDQTARVARAPNVAWRILDGAAVLVAPSSPAVQTLNPVGTVVWELSDGRSIAEIVDAIVKEFEVERTQASLDVERFVRELEGKRLLVVEG